MPLVRKNNPQVWCHAQPNESRSLPCNGQQCLHASRNVQRRFALKDFGLSWRWIVPVKICIHSILNQCNFSEHMESMADTRNKKMHEPRYASHLFSLIWTITVGFGFSPNLLTQNWLPGARELVTWEYCACNLPPVGICTLSRKLTGFYRNRRVRSLKGIYKARGKR